MCVLSFSIKPYFIPHNCSIHRVHTSVFGGEFLKMSMIAEIGHYESQATHSPDFVAGQLAAGVYEATLPEELARSGYQGCVYELALQLRRELG